ncbi:hypothetical protein C8Q77DRAFT_1067503 [Trametes polyzona]|nr:hypothetical protein C8Q77DRAFT_1067503 [Trametes polyzona]
MSPSYDSEDDHYPPDWAIDITRFATLSGALSLRSQDLKALKAVPRERPDGDAAASASARVTRAQSQIILGQRIDFSFQSSQRYMSGKGMPIYALATVSQAELERRMKNPHDQVMEGINMQRLRLRSRAQWPFPRNGKMEYLIFDEWIKVDTSTSRVQLAMQAARVFVGFFEKHRVPLSALPDYPWALRQDGFYRVWLVGLERTENNVFTADLKYVKDYPRLY